ncbi:MAG: deoxyribonuclease IV [Sphaerochaeta sp.]|nr:deoxyribonuclease IV [Sphaerochaeta sp.]MDX9914764.1 deoxyribonuclease IV [Sphaerochaeta sp.]
MHTIGPHTSIAGGLYKAAEQAASLGANGFGMFTKNQRQWRARAITAEEADRFKETLLELGFEAGQILVHDSYLINLANPDDEKWERALGAFIDEVRRVEALGLNLLNFHPGSHLGELDTHTACRRVAAALDQAIEETEYAHLVIENTSGAGSTLGSTFEELAMILDASRHSGRIGCCIDTCHAHTAGYDLSSIELFEVAIARFEALVGLDKLWGMHLNDAKSGAGSRLDRHASLGDGTIGWQTFDHIASDERFASIPLVLETIDESRWAAEVARLRWGKDHERSL